MINSAGLQINDERTLRTILWADTTLGTLTALVGFVFVRGLSPLLGVSSGLIVIISLVTAVYGVGAFALAVRRPLSAPLVRILVMANWLSTAVSAALLVAHVPTATALGLVVFALQIGVVGGLAYLEGRQLVR